MTKAFKIAALSLLVLLQSACSAVRTPEAVISFQEQFVNNDAAVLKRFRHVVGSAPLNGSKISICGAYENALESNSMQSEYRYGRDSEVRVNGLLKVLTEHTMNVKVLSTEAQGCSKADPGSIRILLTAQLDGYRHAQTLENEGWDFYHDDQSTYRNYSGALESWVSNDVSHYSFDAMDVGTREIIATSKLSQTLESRNSSKSWMAFGRILGVYYNNSKTSNADFYAARSAALERGLMLLLMDIYNVSEADKEWVLSGCYLIAKGDIIKGHCSSSVMASHPLLVVDIFYSNGEKKTLELPFKNDHYVRIKSSINGQNVNSLSGLTTVLKKTASLKNNYSTILRKDLGDVYF